MVRKTRKHHTGKKIKGVHSIPELRRSFEHIEDYINDKIALKESKEKLIKDLRKEWSKVFFKELDKKSADAFVSEKLNKKSVTHRKTRKYYGGVGAPNDYTTRQGIYLAPGQIPDSSGHLPLSDGSNSNFGSYVQYVDKGFWNPEPGHSYDPVQGQTRFPTSTPVGMGDNTVHFSGKGGTRKTRKVRRGGASSPAGIVQDMQDMWYGKPVGPSPDQVQRAVNYKM